MNFTYDYIGRAKTKTATIGLTLAYANNRIKTVDGPWDNDTVEYQYNDLGDLKAIVPESGQTTTYGYDYESADPLKIGRLLKVQKGTDTFAYGYDNVNPLIQSLTRPNGSITEYEYDDPLIRLTKVTNKKMPSNQVINSFNYTYYTSGVKTDLIKNETITNGEPIDNFEVGMTTYTPNNLNQLASTTNPNRTYGYDDDGNMTTGYTPEGYELAMTYDAENRMKTAEYTDSSSDVHRTEYSYNGFGLLAEMRKSYNGLTAPSDTKRYVRAGFLPSQEKDGDNNVTMEYTWGLNYGGGIGGLLNLRQNRYLPMHQLLDSNDYAYLYDGKGNVASLIDGSQNPVANYRYDPYGNLMKKTGIIDQPYMFSTKEYDEETGLSNYGFRYYSPEIGKWTTRDPLEEWAE